MLTAFGLVVVIVVVIALFGAVVNDWTRNELEISFQAGVYYGIVLFVLASGGFLATLGLIRVVLTVLHAAHFERRLRTEYMSYDDLQRFIEDEKYHLPETQVPVVELVRQQQPMFSFADKITRNSALPVGLNAQGAQLYSLEIAGLVAIWNIIQSETDQGYMVLWVFFDGVDLPNTVINSRVDSGRGHLLPTRYESAERVTLTGDTSDYFDIYTTDAKRVYELLDPATLWRLVTDLSDCDIERFVATGLILSGDRCSLRRHYSLDNKA